LHTLREIVDTFVVPAALGYTGSLATSAAQAKAAGISIVPQTGIANSVGTMIQDLLKRRQDLAEVIAKAESMHDDPGAQAKLLTSKGADAMAEVREKCDELELMVSDSEWPLPKYREMLFPV
ncbi:MAG TPA: glutamine synthetase type III, partial [Gemmatimonadaceae bacterium]